MPYLSLYQRFPRRLRPALIIAAVCTILGVCFASIWTFKHAAVGIDISWRDSLVAELFFWYTWGLHLPLIYWLSRRLPLDRGHPWRIAAHLVLAFALPLWVFSLSLAAQGLYRAASAGTFADFFPSSAAASKGFIFTAPASPSVFLSTVWPPVWLTGTLIIPACAPKSCVGRSWKANWPRCNCAP